ncbi:DUF4328 domain-containing protein [Myxococcus sp. Y35]|uniref:DUF4328 domain-containing protein n=1 Tax=Pseudomyxococcus flavus TaxID=3115648 RepID=UPI003CF96F05
MLTQPAVPEAAPACPDHAGEPSTGTCERCGRFLCAQCTQPVANVCVPCNARQVLAMPATRGLAQWARGIFYLGAALSGVAALLNLFLFASLNEDGQLDNGTATFFGLVTRVVAGPQLLFTLTAIALYLGWLHRSLKTAIAMGLSKESTAWAMFCWFIPLANLFVPLEVVRGLWRAVGGQPRHASRLTAWWATWLMSIVITNVISVALSGGSPTPTMLSVTALGRFVAEGLMAVAAFLCARVIWDIESMLSARRAQSAESLRPDRADSTT